AGGQLTELRRVPRAGQAAAGELVDWLEVVGGHLPSASGDARDEPVRTVDLIVQPLVPGFHRRDRADGRLLAHGQNGRVVKLMKRVHVQLHVDSHNAAVTEQL